MTWWGVAIKFPTNAIACFWLASSPIADLMEWLRNKVMWLRLTTIRYFLSRKEQESDVFVKEEFLHKKIEKKEHVFGYFWPQTHWHWEEGSVKQYGLWRLAKAIRWLKSLIKFTHNILSEFWLDFCQTFCQTRLMHFP